MAAAFATLPCKVLWRLTPKEAPDQAAIAALKLGTNTQAGCPPCPCFCLSSKAIVLIILAPGGLAVCRSMLRRMKVAQC